MLKHQSNFQDIEPLEGHEDHLSHDAHHHEHTNIALIAIVGVLLLMIVGATAFFLGQNNKAKQTIPQPTTLPIIEPTIAVTDTNTWKTYTNTKYFYSIKYPQDMELYESNDQQSLDFDEQIFIRVSGINDSECRGDCPTETVQTTEDVKIGEISAKKYSGIKDLDRTAGYFPPHSFLRYEIENNGNLYEIEILELSGLPYDYDSKEYPPDRSPGDIPPDKLSVFNEMLSSFTFTK